MRRYVRTALRSLTCTASAVIVLAALVFAVEPSASATAPAPINFADTLQPGDGAPCPARSEVIEGVSVASGVVNDTFAVTDCAHFGSNTLHVKRTLQSDIGTVEMTINGKGVHALATPTSLTFEGTWAIVSGSGAYATLKGQGDFTSHVELPSGDAQETLSGQAHFN
jgi:hypothetical protein